MQGTEEHPQGSSQTNPEFRTVYRTNDLVSSTNKQHEKKRKRADIDLKRLKNITAKCMCGPCLDPDSNKPVAKRTF